MLGNLHVRFGVGAGVKFPGLHHVGALDVLIGLPFCGSYPLWYNVACIIGEFSFALLGGYVAKSGHRHKRTRCEIPNLVAPSFTKQHGAVVIGMPHESPDDDCLTAETVALPSDSPDCDRSHDRLACHAAFCCSWAKTLIVFSSVPPSS